MSAYLAEFRHLLGLSPRQKLSSALNVAGAFLLGWSIFDRSGSDVQVALLVAGPLVALAVNLVVGDFFEGKGEIIGPILLVGPVAGLGWRATHIDWASIGDIPLIAGLASATVAIAALIRSRLPMTHVCSLFVAVALYLLAAGSMLSWAFDQRGTSGPYSVRVNAKWAADGSRGSTNALELGPIGAFPSGTLLRVSRADFRRVDVGDEICLAIARSRFGVSWLESKDC